MKIISKQKAQEKGYKRYFTGVPCKRGHTAPRAVSNRGCIECCRESARRRWRENPEAGRERQKRWRENNLERAREKGRRCRAKYIEKNRARDRQFRRENPEVAKRWWDNNKHKGREYQKKAYEKEKAAGWPIRKRWISRNPKTYLAVDSRRRARKKQALPQWADHELIDLVYQECPCGMHVDHIIPLQNDRVCGLHVPCNLQYLTPEQNFRKSNKFEVGGW